MYFERVSNKPFQFIANCEFVTPRAFSASEQERIIIIEVPFRAYAQKLTEKGPSPSTVILYVSIEVDINGSKSRERRGVKIGSDGCESLRRDEDEDRTVNSMVDGLFLERFSKLLGMS